MKAGYFSIGIFLMIMFISPLIARALPIETDTALTLGFESNALRSFVRIIQQNELTKDGNVIPDSENRKITVINTPLIIPLRLSPNLVFTSIVPLLNVASEKEVSGAKTTARSSGIGDIQLLIKKAFFKKDGLKKTMRFAWKAGLKLPTGDEDQSPALGSGSVDFIVGGLLTYILDRFAMNHDLSYQINTRAEGLRVGNLIKYNVAFEYRLLPETYQSIQETTFNFVFEFNGRYQSRSKNDGQILENTGGTNLFLSPGMQVIFGPRFIVEGLFQYPILQKLNGTQLAVDYTALLGFRYSF